MANPPPKIRWAIFLALTLIAFAIRLPRLGERPMHTDESVNAYIVGQLLAGETFRYDPQDRHGPALAAETLPLVKLFGAKKFADLTESQIRLAPAFTGAATVLLFGAGVEMFGFTACLAAALLFAFAPLPVYYSRYFIHETLFVAVTLGLMLSGWHALQIKSIRFAALAGGCAALMFTCKETAVLHFFAIAVALLAIRFGTPASGTARTNGISKRAVPEAGIPTAKVVLAAITVFIVTMILLFTWFGRNWQVFAGLPHTISSLAARAGGEGHEKPFWYYLLLLGGGWSGGILLALAALGFFGILAKKFSQPKPDRPDPHLFLAIYAPVIFVIYSAIPYKTPWLALNFWLPLAILAGLGFEWIWQKTKFSLASPEGGEGRGEEARLFPTQIPSPPALSPLGRGEGAGAESSCVLHWLFWIAAAVLAVLLVSDTWNRAFADPADEKNPYAYAHTSEDLLRLPARLEELTRQNRLSDPRIAVVAADAWPLPWYLRKFSQVGFWQPGQETGAADFFITPAEVSGPLADRLKSFRPEYFGWRPDVLLVLWSPRESASGHE